MGRGVGTELRPEEAVPNGLLPSIYSRVYGGANVQKDAQSRCAFEKVGAHATGGACLLSAHVQQQHLVLMPLCASCRGSRSRVMGDWVFILFMPEGRVSTASIDYAYKPK